MQLDYSCCFPYEYCYVNPFQLYLCQHLVGQGRHFLKNWLMASFLRYTYCISFGHLFLRQILWLLKSLLDLSHHLVKHRCLLRFVLFRNNLGILYLEYSDDFVIVAKLCHNLLHHFIREFLEVAINFTKLKPQQTHLHLVPAKSKDWIQQQAHHHQQTSF